jgi:hypothetical protein
MAAPPHPDATSSDSARASKALGLFIGKRCRPEGKAGFHPNRLFWRRISPRSRLQTDVALFGFEDDPRFASLVVPPRGVLPKFIDPKITRIRSPRAFRSMSSMCVPPMAAAHNNGICEGQRDFPTPA